MAANGKLPNYKRVITSHNEKGEAIISDVEKAAPWQSNIEGGNAAFSLGWLTTKYPVDMNGEKDLKEYQEYLSNPPGLVQSNGTVLRVVDMAPGITSPMHRTVSLDYGIVIIGEIEVVLDSGDVELLKPGDVCIQRGTMHAWRNTSQTEWARMLYVLQPSKPIEVGGQELKEDYGNMQGVRASS